MDHSLGVATDRVVQGLLCLSGLRIEVLGSHHRAGEDARFCCLECGRCSGTCAAALGRDDVDVELVAMEVHPWLAGLLQRCVDGLIVRRGRCSLDRLVACSGREELLGGIGHDSAVGTTIGVIGLS